MIHQNAIHYFWDRVKKGNWNECWEWQGNYQVTSNGYKLAKYTAGSKVYVVAVFAYITNCGPVPEGMQVNHKCDNSLCCNPLHLYAGTQSQNIQDWWDRVRPKLQVGDSQGFIHKKLSDEDKDSIRASTDRVVDLAAQHGVHRNHIYRIKQETIQDGKQPRQHHRTTRLRGNKTNARSLRRQPKRYGRYRSP